MCQYIKDDGEQCGRSADPFCHDHADTPQAIQYKALKNSQSGSSERTMDTTCDDCGSALRRRERLTTHPRYNRRALFEAYVECECGEYVLGATSVRDAEIPDGWQE